MVFRTSIDAGLAGSRGAAVEGDGVLDVGSGTGAAALCLAARLQGVQITGIEADLALVRLASDNAEESGLAAACPLLLRQSGCASGPSVAGLIRPCHGQSTVHACRQRPVAAAFRPHPGHGGGRDHFVRLARLLPADGASWEAR
ncbi:MAG: class I SAM-dependent methyltransferase [Rhodospirillales bacterium]|nr:class I SAM-dependent methyltransferase [Rhodospirillales bacterium]